MHGSVLGFFAYGALQSREVQGKHVLEVGSLDVNGSVRPMVEARGAASYLGVDVVDGPGVDLVADAEELWKHFDRDTFDVVISTEMLEHVADWQRAIDSMVTVLRPGGVVVWTTRSVGFAYHHPPDRWRYSQAAMAEILGRYALEPLVLADDPEYPGVFVKARKPDGWTRPKRTAAEWRATVEGVTAVPEPRKVLGLPYNPDGTAHYRFDLPLGSLAHHGHRAAVTPYAQASDDLVADADVVVAQRPALEVQVAAWQRWRRLGPALVYETDDLITDPDPSGLSNWLDPEMRAGAETCLRTADLVTVSTPALAEALAGYNPNVAVLPDCVPAALLEVQRPRCEKTVVGWAGGTTHLQDIDLIRDVLATTADLPGVELHFLGCDFSPLARRAARFTPWQVSPWDYYAVVDFDIALVPLADTAFNRCRAPIKALEMAALGIPVVASDVEPYRYVVVDGVTGFLCSDERDWHAAVRTLVHDPAMRQEMGAKARDAAAAYTIEEHWPRWAAAYQSLTSEGDKHE
jgi:SAM-dependent methyltransferase